MKTGIQNWRLASAAGHPIPRALPGRIFFALLFLGLATTAWAQPVNQKFVPGNGSAIVRGLKPTGRLAASQSLHLVISLPLRHQDDLTNLLQRLYDPASPDFHQFLTPEQFTEQFGPTKEDYQAVAAFAKTNGLTVTKTHDSRMFLDLQGNVPDLEKTFHVTLNTYQHPRESRSFYAPNIDPSVNVGLPIRAIAGLDNVALLRPASHKKKLLPIKSSSSPATGSGPGGSYIGSDFRNAYAPNVTLDGTGQMVGLLEADGYYSNDIVAYESLAGLRSVPLINVSIDSFNGIPGADNSEVALDIEMAISMAPGLAAVVVFESPNDTADWIDILDSMSSSNQIKQLSSSWGYTDGEDPNTSFDAIFQKMAAQGQSFFQASGDGDAWVNPIWVPADSPYVTSVGGTSLKMTAAGAYAFETVWNSGDLGASGAWAPNGNGFWGSGGGASPVYSIPWWQQPVDMTENAGSFSMRNIPDVALTADDIWVTSDNGSSGSFMGTSCAAPLWAGFTALANQQAAANGRPTVGFINPAIYALGESSNYPNAFHDTTIGNDTNDVSPEQFFAVPGFDLCTGWGAPAGQALIDALAPDTLGIIPAAGLFASGLVGGPFAGASLTLSLTNNGSSSLTWACGSAATWFSITPKSGTLGAGQSSNILLSLTPAANTLKAGLYQAETWFTNHGSGVAQGRQNIIVAKFPTAGGSYASTVLSLQPAAYWQLNETNVPPAAAIATNVGSLGFTGNGFSFDGVLQGRAGIVGSSFLFTNPALAVAYLGTHVDVPYTPILNPAGPFTVEFWAKPNQCPKYFFCTVSYIDISHNGSNSRFGWVFYEAAGSHWAFRVGNFNGYVVTLTGGSVVPNVWQHVAGVYDGAKVRLYVNGTLVAGPTTANGYAPNSNQYMPLRIGATSFGNRTFDGFVDEVAVFTNALGANTIAAHYQAASTNNAGYGAQILASGAVGFWHLNEPAYSPPAPGTLPTAFNSGSLSYLSDGSYQPGSIPGVLGVTNAGFGSSNLACAFPASTYIDVPGTWIGFSGTLTLSTWAKARPSAGQVQSMVSMGSGLYELTLDGQGYPHFADGVQPFGDLVGTNRMDDGYWHHLVGIYDGTNSEYLYIDSYLMAQSSNATASPIVNGNDLWIGGNPDPGAFQFFNGVIDEVAIFTNALSSAQILWLYSTGLNATHLRALVTSTPLGSVSLSWVAIPGETYAVEYSTNLAEGNWTTLGSPVNATNSTPVISDLPGVASERFYRVVLVP